MWLTETKESGLSMSAVSKIDELSKENEALKDALRFFLNHTYPEEGQSWAIDMCFSEKRYADYKDLVV